MFNGMSFFVIMSIYALSVDVSTDAKALHLTTACEKTLIIPAIVIVINLMIKIVN
jgi:hypothetical protein